MHFSPFKFGQKNMVCLKSQNYHGLAKENRKNWQKIPGLRIQGQQKNWENIPGL